MKREITSLVLPNLNCHVGRDLHNTLVKTVIGRVRIIDYQLPCRAPLAKPSILAVRRALSFTSPSKKKIAVLYTVAINAVATGRRPPKNNCVDTTDRDEVGAFTLCSETTLCTWPSESRNRSRMLNERVNTVTTEIDRVTIHELLLAQRRQIARGDEPSTFERTRGRKSPTRATLSLMNSQPQVRLRKR